MTHDKERLETFRFAVAAGVALAFLLAGCASSRPAPVAETAADSWARCDRSRMVRIMLVCWEARAESVSDSRR